jgi:hypothetical protein
VNRLNALRDRFVEHFPPINFSFVAVASVIAAVAFAVPAVAFAVPAVAVAVPAPDTVHVQRYSQLFACVASGHLKDIRFDLGVRRYFEQSKHLLRLSPFSRATPH